MIPKTVSALDAGTPPDVAYADVYDFQVAGKWAFDGKLEDISDIITPIKGRFAPNTVETTLLYNDKAKKKAYYAFPLKQQTMHIQYWKDMLAERRLQGQRHPQDLEGILVVLVRQGAARAAPQAPASATTASACRWASTPRDSFYSFLTFMDAYDVKLVDDDGKLLVDDPKVRQGLIGALTDYTAPYLKGCTPPSSTSWKDPDNNVAFHNKTTLMTHNATISIAAKWLDDANNEALPAAERAQAKKNYEELIAHRGLPQQAGRHADALSHRGEGRRDLRRGEEQAARQGIRVVPAAGGESHALRRRRARPLVPGDEGRPGRARSGRPTRIANRCTTSMRAAP